jgi:hypothetical protein
MLFLTVIYFALLSVSQGTCSPNVGRLNIRNIFERKLSWRSGGPMDGYFGICLCELSKITKNLSIASVVPNIWPSLLPSTCLQVYRYTRLFAQWLCKMSVNTYDPVLLPFCSIVWRMRNIWQVVTCPRTLICKWREKNAGWLRMKFPRHWLRTVISLFLIL